MIKTKDLGVDEGIYDADLYDGLNSFAHDIPFYKALASKAHGPVLELCCGSGRITLPLLKGGIDITGVDFTRSMLERGREKAAKHGLPDVFVQGDMRKLRLGKKFGLVFIPFNSLQNTYKLDDVEKVFSVVRNHLKKDGVFAFDIFNPSIKYMVARENGKKGAYRFRTPAGRRVRIDEVSHYDSANQTNRATWAISVNGEKPVMQRLDMRCFYPLEMDALLKYNGFRVVHKYGTFDKKPFTSDTLKQIYICVKN